MITEALFRKALTKLERAESWYPLRCTQVSSYKVLLILEQKFTNVHSSQMCLIHLPWNTNLKIKGMKAMQTGLWHRDTTDLHVTALMPCHLLFPLPEDPFMRPNSAAVSTGLFIINTWHSVLLCLLEVDLQDWGQKAYDEMRVGMGNYLLRWQSYRQRKVCHESLVLFHHMLRRRD